MKVHPTAIIHKDSKIEKGVEIGPYSIIGPEVKIGKGTKIGSNVVIEGKVTIGKDNSIYNGAVIGFPPQDLKYKNEPTEVVIGDENIIREFVTIHRGTDKGTKTIIGDRNFLMAYSHVAHNCKIGNGVVLVNNVQLAGWVEVGDFAFLSGGALIHQFVRVGKIAIIRGRARIGFDVPPFMIVDGVENARVCGLNVVGLRRQEFTDERINILKRGYKILFRSNLNISQAVQVLKEKMNDEPDIRELVDFISRSKRGVAR